MTEGKTKPERIYVGFRFNYKYSFQISHWKFMFLQTKSYYYDYYVKTIDFKLKL